MLEEIRSLDDVGALTILSTVARARMRRADVQTGVDQELARAIKESLLPRLGDAEPPTHDPAEAERSISNLLAFYKQAPVSLQPRLRQLWEKAGLGPFPEEQS